MTTQDLIDQYPEIFKQLGGIFYDINRIEVSIITVLSVFFSDRSDLHSERNFIFNEALFDSGIFESLEHKRRLLLKVIENVSRVAHEHNLPFNREKWVTICKNISSVQETRNKLAHHKLSFLPSGKVGYWIKKRAKERLADHSSAKAGSMKLIEFDLNEELAKSEEVCKETDKFLSDFVAETERILATVRSVRQKNPSRS